MTPLLSRLGLALVCAFGAAGCGLGQDTSLDLLSNPARNSGKPDAAIDVAEPDDATVFGEDGGLGVDDAWDEHAIDGPPLDAQDSGADSDPCSTAACPAATPYCDPATGACFACLTDQSCGGLKCDPSSHACVQCIGSAECGGALAHCDLVSHVCVECLGSTNCAAPTPVCDPATHRCVGPCTNDAQCTATEVPHCDLARGVCVECLGDIQCASDAPYCVVPGGTCVECRTSGDCSGDAPYCTPLENRCVQCLTDAHCAQGTCNQLDGECQN